MFTTNRWQATRLLHDDHKPQPKQPANGDTWLIGMHIMSERGIDVELRTLDYMPHLCTKRILTQ